MAITVNGPLISAQLLGSFQNHQLGKIASRCGRSRSGAALSGTSSVEA